MGSLVKNCLVQNCLACLDHTLAYVIFSLDLSGLSNLHPKSKIKVFFWISMLLILYILPRKKTFGCITFFQKHYLIVLIEIDFEHYLNVSRF